MPTTSDNNDFLGGAPCGRPLTEIEIAVLTAYREADRHISDSDLDDEQPLGLTIRTTLGVIRKLRRSDVLREVPIE